MIEVVHRSGEINLKNNQIAEDFKSKKLHFLGIRTLALCEKVNQQGDLYYHTVPIEHTAEFPVSFRKDGEELRFDEAARIWLALPLYKSMFTNDESEADFVINKIKDSKEVIILNCLDNCYGHSLDKLFNAQRHLQEHSNHGLILIIHPSLKSLVPEGVSEVWEVKTSFQNLSNKIKGFDGFVKQQLARYESVYLSKADMNLDYSKIVVEKFTKCQPFPIEKFTLKPIQITFILREDRFWLINRWNQLFYLGVVKFRLMIFLKPYFIGVQNRNIRRLVKRVKGHFNDINFKALGLGKSGSLGKSIEDNRESAQKYMENEGERDSVYANSHMVIGVHGSHLLLASALAGSFISIHQDYKIQGFSEDFIPRHSNPQKQALLGRFLSDKDSIRNVSEHIKFTLHELVK